ncbi:MAG: hypothetical protein AAGA48_19220 [Myxococcota bacterium]
MTTARAQAQPFEIDPDDGPFDWGSYVRWLVGTHGTLSAVAIRLAQLRGFAEDAQSIERALRRLRSRGQRDGGSWGQRCVRVFGVPKSITERVRWMGHYHSRFTDLPRSVCLELLRPWLFPPVAESPARAWVQLGLASVALRGRFVVEADEHLRQAEPVARDAARAEALLVRAFIEHRRRPQRVPLILEEAESEIADLPAGDDRACLWARLIDQRGYEFNVRQRDPAQALALYESLPTVGPPFALVRRHNGIGWSSLQLGDRDAAVAHARRSVEQSGDAGSLRLRVMALNLLARALDNDEGQMARARALAIASRLEDEALRVRLVRD